MLLLFVDALAWDLVTLLIEDGVSMNGILRKTLIWGSQENKKDGSFGRENENWRKIGDEKKELIEIGKRKLLVLGFIKIC